MLPGDSVWFVAPDEEADRIARLFGGMGGNLGASVSFFGEFVVDPECLAGDLADAYGLGIEARERTLSVGQMLLARLGRAAVVGDRVHIGAFTLTVREMSDAGALTSVGIKCPAPDGLR
jgi:cell volume regulation protein A